MTSEKILEKSAPERPRRDTGQAIKQFVYRYGLLTVLALMIIYFSIQLKSSG